MTTDSWTAYNADSMKHRTFSSFDDAEAWLTGLDGYSGGDKMNKDVLTGGSFVAKITHRTAYEATDWRDLYHVHDEMCPVNCKEAEWPYSTDIDVVGMIVLNEVGGEADEE